MKSSNALQKVSTYILLRKRIEQTLLLGRRNIEKAKVLTYLRTGKIIDSHISRYGSRAEYYGNQVIQNLANDLDLDSTVLWRCLKFHLSFDTLASRQESLPPNLTWSHYRELITIPDKKTRFSYMKKAAKSGWSAIRLSQIIQQEVLNDSPEGQIYESKQLIPKKGSLYTYRLISPGSVHDSNGLDKPWVDLGFQCHHQIPVGSKGFKAGSIIESVKDKNGIYTIRVTNRTEKDLYTYRGSVEKIIDGDTIRVVVDVGFGNRSREYLRLRGIDTPEIDSPEGKKAREFVKKELRTVDHILFTSTKADKYGRYLADIFYGPENKKFLNQRLLDEGLAFYYY